MKFVPNLGSVSLHINIELPIIALLALFDNFHVAYHPFCSVKWMKTITNLAKVGRVL